jgi:hypothetical protein
LRDAAFEDTIAPPAEGSSVEARSLQQQLQNQLAA